MPSYWDAAYGWTIKPLDECFYLTKEQLLDLHKQLYTEDPERYKPPTSDTEQCRPYRIDRHIINHWIGFCEWEHNQDTSRPLNYSLILPPLKTSAMPHQRVLQFYKDYLLPLVRAGEKLTFGSILNRLRTFLSGLLDRQFKQPGVPWEVYAQYAWTEQFNSNVELYGDSMKKAMHANRAKKSKSASNCMQQRSVGKVIEHERLTAMLAIMPTESSMPQLTLLASQAQIASCAFGANRSVKEGCKTLYCLTSEPIRQLELETVTGVCAPHMRYKIGHIFDTVRGDKRKRGQTETKESQFAVEDYFREQQVEECPIWRLCRYLRCRMHLPGMRLDDHLHSRESLEGFLDSPLYISSDGAGFGSGKLRHRMQRLEREAGYEHLFMTGTHQLRQYALKRFNTVHGDPARARAVMGHAARNAHEKNYLLCQFPSLLDMAKKGGHMDGQIRLYRTVLWPSRMPEYQPLHHEVDWISEEAEHRALQLSERTGLRRWIATNRFLADILLQDLASDMGVSDKAEAGLMWEIGNFPFLAPDHKLRPLWDKFRAHAAHTEERMRCLDQPKVPAQLPDGSMLPVPADVRAFKREKSAKTAKTIKSSDIELATKSHFVENRNPLGLQVNKPDIKMVYKRFAQPLPNVPFSLLEIMAAQGMGFKNAWRNDFSTSFGWQSRIWARINDKRRRLGMTEEQAVESTQSELNEFRAARGSGGPKEWVKRTMTKERNPAVGERWLLQ
ncbi:g10128 [Coccomyxa elongata]